MDDGQRWTGATLAPLAGWGVLGSGVPLDLDGAALADDPAGLVGAALSARLSGPLLAAVEQGAIDLPGSCIDDLVEGHRRIMMWCLLLEQRLVELAGELPELGRGEVLVLKGPASAHLDHPNPALRSFADLDLLVRAERIGAFVEDLERLGARRVFGERAPGFDRWFAKSVPMAFPDDMEVDVHRTLASGVLGWQIPVDDLFDRRASLELGGATFGVLAPVHRLLHTCYHVVLGSREPRLVHRREVAVGLAGSGDPAEVALEAARWGGTEVLAAAVDAAAPLGAIDPRWERWRASVDVPLEAERRVERARAEGSSFGRGGVDLLRVLPSWRLRAAYLRAVAWPDRSHLQSRGLRRRDLLRRARSRASGGGPIC